MSFRILAVCARTLGLYLTAGMTLNAEIPRTPEFKNYAHILKRSPFEIKINQMVEKIDKPKVRIDYFLRAATKLKSGWLVVIVDRKKPKENIVIKQGQDNGSGIKLINVIQNIENYKLTLATLKVGTQEMTIGYNKSELQKVHQQPVLPPSHSTQGKNDKSQKTQLKLSTGSAVNPQKNESPTPSKPLPKGLTPAF